LVGGDIEDGEQGETSTNANGGRTIHIATLGNDRNGALMAGVVLQHEAYRDGDKNSADQKAELERAATAHTEMSIRMGNDSRYGMEFLGANGNLLKDIYEYSKGADNFNEYVAASYDNSSDYWKLLSDGSLEYDGKANLYDENGEILLQVIDEISRDDDKKATGRYVETGLARIMGITNTEAAQLMATSGLQYSVADGLDVTDTANWSWKGQNDFNKTVAGMDAPEMLLNYLKTEDQYNVLVERGLMDTEPANWLENATSKLEDFLDIDIPFIDNTQPITYDSWIQGMKDDALAYYQDHLVDGGSDLGDRMVGENFLAGFNEVHGDDLQAYREARGKWVAGGKQQYFLDTKDEEGHKLYKYLAYYSHGDIHMVNEREEIFAPDGMSVDDYYLTLGNPPDTYCNFNTSTFSEAYGGSFLEYYRYREHNANDINDKLKQQYYNNPDGFYQSVSAEEAVRWQESGGLSFTSWKNDEGRGHISPIAGGNNESGELTDIYYSNIGAYSADGYVNSQTAFLKTWDDDDLDYFIYIPRKVN
ncbi:hypothetical protein, partial [Spirochaeta cellobiosiphila]|uniref:hypothetical protein n=1 Tax=Spirochaeta cellobiosiphila TaxID=504483 RepID=UPI00048F5DCF